MNQQEMIDFCKTAGIEDAERIIRNASYLAEDRKLIAPATLEQFAAFLMFLANQELQKALTEENQYHFAQETYDASAKLHHVYLLSAAGIHPAPQSELTPKETIMPATPLFVIKALAEVDASGLAENMLDRDSVEMLVTDQRAAEWLCSVSDGQYEDALEDMLAAGSDDWMGADQLDTDEERRNPFDLDGSDR